MTLMPRVELLFHPTDLNPQDLARAGQFLGSPAQALEAGLIAARAIMIDRMKVELEGYTGVEMSPATLVRIADTAWQVAFWRYRKISAPVMADAYVRAYRRANAGDVPIQLIYDLADRHADRIGEYFHESSKQSMVEGFNTYVNRRMGARAAADRVMDAYGLTPRQMRGYTAATASLEGKVTGPQQRSLKAKVRDYITRSFRARIQKFMEQEEHNIDQQAQQFAWMWLVDKGRLSPMSEKVWITAKDEKVCKICGPLHGQRVGVNEKFSSSKGEFWTPGVHPNCRCFVRLIENTFKIQKDHQIQKAYEYGQWVEREHPRGAAGRFTDKPKPRITTMTRTAPADAEWMQMMQTLTRTEAQPKAAPLAVIGESPVIGEIGVIGESGGLIEAEPEAPTQIEAPAKSTLSVIDLPAIDAAVIDAPVIDVAPIEAATIEAEEITVGSLMEANPALSVDHLVAASLAYDQAVSTATAPASAPAPARARAITRIADVYDIPGDYAAGASQPVPGSNLVYLYDDLGEVATQGDQVQFSSEDRWLRGDDARTSFFAEAVKDVNKQVGEFVRQAMEDDVPQRQGSYTEADGTKMLLFEAPDGRSFEISDYDLTRAITDIAFKTEDPAPVTSYYPDYSNPDAVQLYGDLPVSVIGETLNATPELFEKTIYVTAHGHNEQALAIDEGSRYGHEVWANPGDFEATSDSTAVLYPGPFRVVNVEPIAPVREVTD